VVLGFAHALDVNLFGLAELTTVFALGDGTALLLYLEKRAICVFAGGGAMAFDTSFAGIFLIGYKNHCRRKIEGIRWG
jgi:hypothetical protein